MIQEETLTVKQALEQGYTHYVFNSDGFQSLKDIVHISDEDFNRDDIRVVEKESYHPYGISSKDIAELLADHLESNNGENTGDDTSQVYDTIMELDFTEAENKITEALSAINYYRASKIKLIR
jgi:hypothetical protein